MDSTNRTRPSLSLSVEPIQVTTSENSLVHSPPRLSHSALDMTMTRPNGTKVDLNTLSNKYELMPLIIEQVNKLRNAAKKVPIDNHNINEASRNLQKIEERLKNPSFSTPPPNNLLKYV